MLETSQLFLVLDLSMTLSLARGLTVLVSVTAILGLPILVSTGLGLVTLMLFATGIDFSGFGSVTVTVSGLGT